MRVWIETGQNGNFYLPYGVTLYVRVWIETIALGGMLLPL